MSSALPDYSLEHTLAVNYSTEVYITSPVHLSPYLYHANNTHVVQTSVVANDPADFSRNSYTQRTLNDVLMSHGHESERLDLLRLVSGDHEVTQMWELVHYLTNDNILLRVQQLHLLVYIGLYFI